MSVLGLFGVRATRVRRDRALDKSGELRTLLTARDGLTQPESLCYLQGALYITDDKAGTFAGPRLQR
jgi:hypothetical protein